MFEDLKKINEILNYHGNKKNNRQSRMLSVRNTKNLSITGTFSDIKPWGVSPSFTVEKVYKELISAKNKNLTNHTNFNDYVNDNFELYWVDHPNSKKDELLSKAVFAQCIVAMCQEFSVKIICKTIEMQTEFKNILIELGIYYRIEENSIFLFGRLTDKQILKLNETSFSLNLLDKQLYLFQNNYGTLPWEDLYERLTCNSAFYSGVLTNLLEVSEREPSSGNMKIPRLETKIIGTTFATVLGTGHPKLTYEEGSIYKEKNLMDHYLLQDYKESIQRYQVIEKKLQENLFNTFNEDDFYTPLNHYLKSTIFPVIISAAATILTCNEEIVYIKRGKNIEHQDKLSCAVTGYIEINDPTVTFYEDCVDDDKPTINYNYNSRFTYSEEFSRETRAELGINIMPGEWDYLGLLVSGVKSVNRKESISTIDIEILAQVKSEYSLQRIRRLGSRSIESDENENILGLKINTYSNLIDKYKNMSKSLMNKISENKDLIILLAISVPMIFNLLSIFDQEDSILNGISQIKDTLDYMKVIEITLNLIIIWLFYNTLSDFIKSKKILHNINIIEGNFKKQPSEIVKKLFSKVNGHYTYLFLAVTLIYLTNEKYENDK